jgi:hypothetical protein
MRARALLFMSVMVGCAACSSDDTGQMRQVDGYFLTLSSDPAKLEVGEDAEFTVNIERDDDPMAACHPRFRQYMPNDPMAGDHSWYGMEPLKKGLYRARSAEFSMGGDWEVELQFNCGDGPKSVTFSYQLVWM